MSDLFGNIIEGIVGGAVKKATAGFVAKGDITAAQQVTLDAGIMLEIKLALDIYQQSQQASAGSATGSGVGGGVSDVPI